MLERIDEGIIAGSVDFVTIKQTQTIIMQMKESICKIKGKLIGTGFFCHINYENKNIPCLMTNFHVLDKEYIKNNNKIKISMNDNAINEEITINEQDIIYQSKKEEYDLIIIKLKEGEEYIKNINYFELDENLFNKNSINGYESIYILHYPNAQNAAVSYGNGITYDPNYKYDIQHKCNTLSGSSGGPILNLLTNKVIGIHKGFIQKKDGIKYNIGTFLKDSLGEIKNKDNKINNQINNNNLYNNFNIELKKPIHIFRDDKVSCLTAMNDGRLVFGYNDRSIIIYNKETYKPDLIIKEHDGPVRYITQLSSGILVSCSKDKSIKLYSIKGNKYKVLQSLNQNDAVYEIKELKNKSLASISSDRTITFYIKDNLKYKKDYHKVEDDWCSQIKQTKDNEICYFVSTTLWQIKFYDFIKKKVKKSLWTHQNHIITVTKDLLITTGFRRISIININNYEIIRSIEVSGKGFITGVYMPNQNILLTGDSEGIIKQWRIEDDNLILVSKVEKAHDSAIKDLKNLGNGHLASCSVDNTIKIW